jgi:RHS repeat-associated protein
MRFLLTLSLYIMPLMAWSQFINFSGQFTNVCPGENYTYTISVGSTCLSATTIDCNGCYDVTRTPDNKSITLKWQTGNIGRTISATAICTEPDNLNNPDPTEISEIRAVTIAQASTDIYFCSLDPISYFTTTATAEESSNNSCTTTTRVSQFSFVDFSGANQSPFVNYDPDFQINLLGFVGGQANDGGRAQITFNWRAGWEGKVTFRLQYVMKNKNNFNNCQDASPLGEMGIYTFVRTDNAPTGIIASQDAITLNGPSANISLPFQSTSPNIPITKIRYFLNTDLVYESQTHCGFNYTHTVNAAGTYTFNTQLLTPCGNWISGPSKTVNVYPTCYQDNAGAIVAGIIGLTPETDGTLSIKENTNYTVQVSGVTDFANNYNLNFDIGTDGTVTENSFSVNKILGSYTISFANKPGRESCPAIPSFKVFLGGKDHVIVDDPCPVVLPNDFKKFGFEKIDSTNIVLNHFKGTVKSKTSIVVMPGVTLDLGGELELLPRIPAAENDLTKNFTEQTAFDEYGRPLAATRVYFDDQGRQTQTQSKSLEEGIILTSQTLYDAYGRPALSTLAAPTSVRQNSTPQSNAGCRELSDEGLDFSFASGFVKSTDGTPYDFKHFDIYKSGETEISKENNPDAVKTTEPGSLGWYYSANNGTATGALAKFNEEHVATTNFPYSRTLFHRDGTGAVKGATKPGDIFRAGAGHVPTGDTEPVAANDPHLLAYLDVYDEVFTRPSLLGGEFFRSVSYDAEGKKAMTYTDKGGNTIISLYFGDKSSPVTRSYSIYDNAGRLKVSVSPNGVNNFVNNTNFTTIDKTTYTYNHKGWLLSMTEPDAGTTNYVYRKDGTIRFSQNAQQFIEGKFSYTNYDRSGRPIESGECASSFSFTPAVLESTAADGGFTGTREQQVQTVYDLADTNIPVQRTQRFVHGAVSMTSNANTTAWYSYDERGRVEWMVQRINNLGNEGVKTLDYRYGSTGAVQEVLYQKGKTAQGNIPGEQFTHFYEYDFDGRLFKVYTSPVLLVYNKLGEVTNPSVLKLQATYHYYLHGPLKRVEYASNVQGIDYVYTADGALKAINDANLLNDPGKDGLGNSTFRPDVFGMTLDYYSGDYLSNAHTPSAGIYPSGTVNSFTGLIKGNRWHSPVENHVTSGYGYRYDNRNQMSDARWVNTIPAIMNPYLESIGSYDVNGNILSLNRKNNKGVDIADFKYKYSPGTNKLEYIATTTDPVNPTDYLKKYEYNAIGQMTQQEDIAKGKKLKSKYDVTGKVTEVRDENNQLVTTYSYDDRGFRLSKTSYSLSSGEGQGEAKLITWYVRDASGNIVSTYEDDLTDQKPAVPTELPIYASGRIGLYKPQFDLTYYELTDHLGNVRAVIGDKVTVEYEATMETERASKEMDFLGINRAPTATYNNHTPSSVTLEGETTVIGNPNEVIRINNAQDLPKKPVGGGIILWVHPGDKISTEVFVKYSNFNQSNHNAITGMATQLVNTFGAAGTVIDGVSIFQGIDEPPAGVYSALSNVSDNLPHAFLTYIVFDRNNKPVKFDYAQVSTAAQTPVAASQAELEAHQHEHLFLNNIEIEKEGYIYIYVSNESDQNMDVYFDDLKVTHEYSDIVGGGDYYPFGLEMNDRRIAREKHRFGYQGLYSEKDEETGWNHFELREYDPIVGRWTVPDPYNQYASPYLGMGNTPSMRFDPTGGTDGLMGPEPGSIAQIWNEFKSYLKSLFTLTPENSDREFSDEENSIATIKHASKNLEKAKYISEIQVEPYMSISIGKETQEGSQFSYNGTVTLSPSGVFYSAGLDYTLSKGNVLGPLPSLSFSGGLVIGDPSGLNGYGGYVTGGAYHLGFQASRSINNSNYYLPNGLGDTYTIGGVVSTTRFWGGGGAGVTNPWLFFRP